MSYCPKHDHYYSGILCPRCTAGDLPTSNDLREELRAQVAALTAENAETRVVLRQFYGADEPIPSAGIARKMLAEVASLRAEVARWRENAETADEILDRERRESRADLTRVLRETAAENERLRASYTECVGSLGGVKADRNMLSADLARVNEDNKRISELGRIGISQEQIITDLRAKLAALRGVVEWFVHEFPCPEIHASIDNRPGRCPESSDDPNEYCASARFQRALAASEEE